MKFRANRTFLLSMRGRRLPLLWFLSFFAPYLCCFLFAAPHFHSGECSHHKSHAAMQWHQLQQSSWAPDASQCLECAWTWSAQGQLATPLPVVSLQSSPVSYFLAVATPLASRSFTTNNRGPPLS